MFRLKYSTVSRTLHIYPFRHSELQKGKEFTFVFKTVFFIQVLLNVPEGLAEHQFWRAPYIGSGQQQKGLCPWQVGEIADF